MAESTERAGRFPLIFAQSGEDFASACSRVAVLARLATGLSGRKPEAAVGAERARRLLRVPGVKLADYLAEALIRLGVRHVFGVGGANIEDVFGAVQRRRPELVAVLCKHEHGAGTAADAYSRLRGFGAVMVTSGGAAMNLVHALAEARASSVPLLAIVGEPPANLQGAGAFQDTSGKNGALDAREVFRAVSNFCERVVDVQSVPRLLEDALQAALGGRPGPAVLLIAKDRQVAELESPAYPSLPHAGPEPSPAPTELLAALSGASRVLIIAGSGVARTGAQPELARLARVLGASVAVEPDARDAFDNRDPLFRGVAGAMGPPEVLAESSLSAVCLLVGARLPLLARMGLEPALEKKPVFSLGGEPPFVEATLVPGPLRPTLAALAAALELRGARRSEQRPPESAEPLDQVFGSAAALRAVERVLPENSVVLVDAGNTGAHAIHYLSAPPRGRWLVAMGMAGMGWSYGAAVGAALATGGRVTVLSGDGAFFMHGLEVHTAVEHSLPITFVVFNNASHGMCLVRERLLLHEHAGYNDFQRSHLGAGLRAMLPRLFAEDCRTLEQLEAALGRARESAGPAFIAVELDEVEIPPFGPFQRMAGQGVRTVERRSAHA